LKRAASEKQSLMPVGGQALRNHEKPVILSEAKNLALIFSFSLHHGPERDSSLRMTARFQSSEGSPQFLERKTAGILRSE